MTETAPVCSFCLTFVAYDLVSAYLIIRILLFRVLYKGPLFSQTPISNLLEAYPTLGLYGLIYLSSWAQTTYYIKLLGYFDPQGY